MMFAGVACLHENPRDRSLLKVACGVFKDVEKGFQYS